MGVSTRIIGAIIMVHGDDAGLKLPPRIADASSYNSYKQCIKKAFLKKTAELYERLKKKF